MLQGGFQLLYTIYQDVGDKPLIDEGITNFTLNVVDRATGGFTMLTTDEGTYNNATITLNLRAVCKENYYDSDCSILRFCEPQDDDTLGHYTCDSNGTLVCLTGYQNIASNCTEVTATTGPPTITNETSPVTTTQETQTSDPIMTVTTTNIVTNDKTTLATMGATTNQDITNDSTVSMGTDNVRGNNVTTSAPAPVGMDIVAVAAEATVGGLVVILLIVITVIIIAVLLISKAKRPKKQDKEGNSFLNYIEKHHTTQTSSFSYISCTMYILVGIITVQKTLDNGGDGDDADSGVPMYTMVQKESK